MADELTEFVERLKQAHGDHLKSIVLYGEAVATGRLDDEAPKNVLVVLEEITPGELQSEKGVTEWWRSVGNPLPVYFSASEMQDSSDVFPIEFMDMSHTRQVLYGNDPFEGLEIHTHNLRHQLEYELRGKLIRLRSLFMPASANPARLASLMADSLDSFAILFRHVLGMRGVEAPADKNAVLIKIADELGLDKGVFARISKYAADEEVWLEAETSETFGKYLKLIERVIQAVNAQQ